MPCTCHLIRNRSNGFVYNSSGKFRTNPYGDSHIYVVSTEFAMPRTAPLLILVH